MFFLSVAESLVGRTLKEVAGQPIDRVFRMSLGVAGWGIQD